MGDCDYSNCMHMDKTAAGVCTSCGLCCEDVDLKHPTVTASHSQHAHTPMKFVVRNPDKINDTAITQVLTALNLTSYKSVVRDLLRTTKFKSRMKKEDKAIVVLYHLLKASGFPIVVSDILRFTSMTKYRLLKIHRDTFEYTKRSREYMMGIFERAACFLDKRGIRHTGTPDEFFKLSETYRCCDPKSLCLAYFLELSKVSNVILRGHDEYDIYQIDNIRRKLKCVNKDI